MTRRPQAAVGRSTATDRWLILLAGLVTLAVAASVLAVGFGLLGTARAGRPVLDPIAVGTVETYPNVARTVAAALGLLLLLIGLLWAVRALRPERHPALLVQSPPVEAADPAESGTLPAATAAEVVAADARQLPGVSAATAELVGSEDTPGLRLTLQLAPDSDPAAVTDALEPVVLAPARSRLGVDRLPTAVRLKLARKDRAGVSSST